MNRLAFHPEFVNAQFAGSLKLVAFVGFLAAATLLIGFNHKVFEVVMGERSKAYWWLFMVVTILPLLLIIYAFSYFFGNLFSPSP